MASKGVDTNTLLLLGGMAALGIGLFVMARRPAPSTETEDETAMLAQMLNVQSAQQQAQMAQMLQAFKTQTAGASSYDKKLAEQQLISGYVNLGVGTATQIMSAIGTFF